MSHDLPPRDGVSPIKTHRSWLRYRLGTLVILTTVCAIGVTWWRQWSLSAELAETRGELARQTSQLAMLEAIHEINRSLELTNPEHRVLFESLQDYGWLFSSMDRRQVGTPDDKTEVILFQNDIIMIPGRDESLAVLLSDGKLLDFVSRQTSTRSESHHVMLEDVDCDGVLEVAFHCQPGMWSNASDPFTLYHTVSKEGFGPATRRSGVRPVSDSRPCPDVAKATAP